MKLFPQTPISPRRRITILICLIILLSGALYLLEWNANRARVEQNTEKLVALYTDDGEADSSVEAISVEPTPEAVLNLLPTAPPVLPRFHKLLEENSETVGFLRVGEIETPVVQRKNDNEFYLNHDFYGQEAREGAIFLDGSNLLVPEDQCLIIYGHNMKDDTMFGKLTQLGHIQDFRKGDPISFDTLYAEQRYIPFAVVSASASKRDPEYLPFRTFLFSGEEQFDSFISLLKKRSVIDCALDINSDDGLLLLVTCRYQTEEGRMIIALRKMRETETEEEISAVLQDAKLRKLH